ncbi:hypothetical protein H0H93_004814 [Arthromyces matolae]|nr:hypothetical protein H0H93_004814 [Arthromyces matolae]
MPTTTPPRKKAKLVDIRDLRLPGTPGNVRADKRNAAAAQRVAETAAIATAVGLPAPVPPPPSTKPMRKGGQKRDIGGQIRSIYKNKEEMAVSRKAFDRKYLVPIAPTTLRNIEYAKRMWIGFCSHALGEEGCRLSLEENAPFPSIDLVLQFLCFSATHGKSYIAIEGRTGWNYNYLKEFLNHFHRMAIKEWTFKNKLFGTQKREKRSVREEDLVEVLAACLHPNLCIETNYARLTLMSFIAFLYQHGSRPGALVEVPEYRDEAQYLKWGDTEWVIEGHEPGTGLLITVNFQFNWLKSKRNEASKFVRTVTHNLHRERIPLDSQLLLEVLAIHHEIFEEDLVDLRQANPETLSFPILLTIKDEAKEQPIWRLPSQPSQPCSYSSLSNFSFRSFRYGFASDMLTRMPSVHLKYIMGHRWNSAHAETTYQVSDRQIDISADRYPGEKSNTTRAQIRSSVTWLRTKKKLVPAFSLDELKSDKVMTRLCDDYRVLEDAVFAKYGVYASAVSDEHQNTDLVVETLEARADVLLYYADLQTRAQRTPLLKPPDRSRSISGSSTLTDAQSEASTLVEDNENDGDANLDKSSTALDDAFQTFENLSKGHPLMAVVHADEENPRYSFIMRLLAKLEADSIRKEGKCLFCFSDESLTKEQQDKIHRNKYSEHVWTCEVDHNPNTWRCPVCAELIAKPNSDEDDDNNVEVQEALQDHCDRCLASLISKCQPETDSDSDDDLSDAVVLPRKRARRNIITSSDDDDGGDDNNNMNNAESQQNDGWEDMMPAYPSFYLYPPNA